MGRPKGSQNRVKRPIVRKQRVLRMSDMEYDVGVAVASIQGLTWAEWARKILRMAAGLTAEDTRENKYLRTIDSATNKKTSAG